MRPLQPPSETSVDEALDAAFSSFLGRRSVFEVSGRKAFVSRAFKWYMDDFVPKVRAIASCLWGNVYGADNADVADWKEATRGPLAIFVAKVHDTCRAVCGTNAVAMVAGEMM